MRGAAGFLGKLYVFSTAIQGRWLWLALAIND
jgi:NADH:ubiquinone oxidoreductase subunit 2 (subunit N)